MNYKCPLCGSPLTDQHYHKVVKLQERKEKVQKGEVEKLKKQAAQAKAAAVEVRAKAKVAVEAAKKEAALAEQRKSAIRDKRLVARIKKLEEEKKSVSHLPYQFWGVGVTMFVTTLRRSRPSSERRPSLPQPLRPPRPLAGLQASEHSPCKSVPVASHVRSHQAFGRYQPVGSVGHTRKEDASEAHVPQEIGLADEGVLVKKLEKEFPEDRIEHTGKGGDVLHYVTFDEEDTGCIVYECKRTDRISSDHVAQTALAKKTRQANYGILVTTGTRRGFSGLDQESGIFLVAQAGVLTLARICRDSLITMAKQRLDAAAKAAAAKRLMDYVTSPICKTPLEEAISHAERAHRNLLKEMKQHANDWKERYEIYQTIHYDVSHVQKNIGRVLGGDEPLKLEKPSFEPLALPLK